MSKTVDTADTGTALRDERNSGVKYFNSVRMVELLVIFAVAAGFYIYFGTFSQLWADWNRQNEDASYGMVVPFFAAIFVMLKWRTIKRTPVKPTLWGIALVLAGMLMRTAAEFGQVAFIKYLAFVVILAGGTWTVVGHRMFKHLIFPFLFLFLMMPVPAFLYQRMAVPLMSLAAKAGTLIMQVAGVAASRSGNVISVPNLPTDLNVAEACSGMKSLLVLGAVAIAFAYITRRGLICRIFISLSAVPIAIVMNALRVGGVGILAVYVAPSMAVGFMHTAQGYVFFLVEMVLLFAEGAVIAWIIGKPVIELPDDGAAPSGKRDARPLFAVFAGALRAVPRAVSRAAGGAWARLKSERISAPAGVCVCGLALFVVALYFFHDSVKTRTADMPLRIPFSQFTGGSEFFHPYGRNNATGEDGRSKTDLELAWPEKGVYWTGFAEPIQDIILKVAEVDEWLNIRYFRWSESELPDEDRGAWSSHDPAAKARDAAMRISTRPVARENVSAYVAYHRSAAKGINNGALHYPDVCYPANGYEPVETRYDAIYVEGYCGGRVDVVRYIYRSKKSNLFVMVAYHINNNGQAVVDRTSGKLMNWWKLVTGERVGFMAQVQLNTIIGVFEDFDPRTPPPAGEEEARKYRENMEKYNRQLDEAWQRISGFGGLFLKKLGRYLPEPASY